jgi:hypothetical protein
MVFSRSSARQWTKSIVSTAASGIRPGVSSLFL